MVSQKIVKNLVHNPKPGGMHGLFAALHRVRGHLRHWKFQFIELLCVRAQDSLSCFDRSKVKKFFDGVNGRRIGRSHGTHRPIGTNHETIGAEAFQRDV
jgi:hypothetical protein